MGPSAWRMGTMKYDKAGKYLALYKDGKLYATSAAGAARKVLILLLCTALRSQYILSLTKTYLLMHSAQA